MLTATQFTPYLRHADEAVHRLAIEAISRASDPAPASADDFTAALDELLARPGAAKHAQRLASGLSRMSQSERSLAWILERLARTDVPSDVRDELEGSIARLGYGLLMRAQDSIDVNRSLSEALRDHLKQKYELAFVPAQELWDRLMALETASDLPMSEGSRLVQSLSRHLEASQWAMAMLADKSIQDWREIHAIEILSSTRFRPAAPMLFERLLPADADDVVLEVGAKSLARIGGPEVLNLFQGRYEQIAPENRNHAAEVPGCIRLPQSEQLLMGLLDREPDKTIRTSLAAGLCQLGASQPATFSRLEDMVRRGDWDRMLLDLNEDVAALFLIAGHQPAAPLPAASRRPMRSVFGNSTTRDDPKDELPWDEDIAPWDFEEAAQAIAQTSTASRAENTPIRRDAPKVGRNDPCPCGSGKKFKKCCGK